MSAPAKTDDRRPVRTETLLVTALALLAFASNSLLTRMALGPGLIDAASFTAVRLGAGAVMLVLLVRVQAGTWSLKRPQNLAGAAMLCLYAVPFSYAYVRIGAAAGALVLFGVVQITMIGWGIARGERPSPRAWLGFAVAVGGLVLLTVPSASRPDPLGVALMTIAGVAWGAYSLLGRGAADPVAANCSNFIWSLPFAAMVVAVAWPLSATTTGLIAAVACGAVTSGLGYAVWYRALRGLEATQAAIVQLSVPVIAAFGAIVLLDETLSIRLLISAVAILGGIALVLTSRSRVPQIRL